MLEIELDFSEEDIEFVNRKTLVSKLNTILSELNDLIDSYNRGIILKAASETKGIITIEDHNIIGGLGSAVSEVLSEEKPTYIKRLGINDIYSTIGPAQELWKKYKLDASSISEAVKIFLCAMTVFFGQIIV